MLKSKYDSPNKPIPGQRLLIHHCCMSDPKSIDGRIPIHCSWYFPVAEEGGILFSEASLSRKYPNFSLSEEPSVVHVLKFMFKNAYSSVIALVHHLFSSIYRFGFVPERICFHPFFQTQRRRSIDFFSHECDVLARARPNDFKKSSKQELSVAFAEDSMV